jgi:hypothetical protein
MQGTAGLQFFGMLMVKFDPDAACNGLKTPDDSESMHQGLSSKPKSTAF